MLGHLSRNILNRSLNLYQVAIFPCALLFQPKETNENPLLNFHAFLPKTPNNLVKAVTILTCILVDPCSNLGGDTFSMDRCFCDFSQVLHANADTATLTSPPTLLFRVFTSLFINHPDIEPYIPLFCNWSQ
jgi:hypothetical protein